MADAHQQTLGWPFQQIVQVMSDAPLHLICVSCFDIQLLQASDIMHEPFGRQNWPSFISILMHPSAYKRASGLPGSTSVESMVEWYTRFVLQRIHTRTLPP